MKASKKAPRMNWGTLIAPYRHNRDGDIKVDQIVEGRSPYQKDQDKIYFSSSFRRLGKKTQVHPLADNDHIHTRLHHSIEVASVGRSLGVHVGYKIAEDLPDRVTSPIQLGEIVQAACLAHDIGNPPFGHAGEYAIQDWFTRSENDGKLKKLKSGQKMDLKLFDGNALGFRILTKIEYDTFAGGMRLTYPTLAAMLKYPWSSLQAEGMSKAKFSCFESELQELNDIGKKLGLIKLADNHWCRHPLAYLVEAADDLCYSILDLEDARELRIVTLKRLRNKVFDNYHKEDQDYKLFMDTKEISLRRKLAYARGKTMHKAIHAITEAFLGNYDNIMAGQPIGDLISKCDSDTSTLIEEAKKLCREEVYKHPRKIELEIGAYTAIGTMLQAFFEAASELSTKHAKDLGFKNRRVIDLLGTNAPGGKEDLYNIIMRFLDYIGGMTDQFATHISQQIQGIGAGNITR
ncbi:deoxyguanosinetriphosphate triphosphohydrolase [Desulfocurvibacter africanus]|uniref:deoxyguanosinetriphosphate triphosphohydrolase n=1 Tax=Desulfocurvibacter africanus TaxID=873 RepID=UPI002FDA0E48